MMRFGPEYWDKNGLYRAPVGFILVLVLLLRPYILWLLTAATRREDLNLVAIFYPLKQQFFVALSVAAISLVISLCYIMRRPNAAQWPKYIWRYGRSLLLLNLVLDIAWSIMQIKAQYFNFSIGLATQLLLLCWAAVYVIKSRYLAVYFADWPELDENEHKGN